MKKKEIVLMIVLLGSIRLARVVWGLGKLYDALFFPYDAFESELADLGNEVIEAEDNLFADDEYDGERNEFIKVYPEWERAVGIEANDICVREEEYIYVLDEIDLEEESLQDFADKITNHNRFVASKTAAYFIRPEDFVYELDIPSYEPIMIFSSDISPASIDANARRFYSADNLGVMTNCSIKFAELWYSDAEYIFTEESEDVQFDSEVVVVYLDKEEISDFILDHDFLKHFPKAKKLVFHMIRGEYEDLKELDIVEKSMGDEYGVYGVYDYGIIWPVNMIMDNLFYEETEPEQEQWNTYKSLA